MKLPLLCKNHFPYGAYLTGRHASEDSYRYGFNGMESDDEVSGEKNSYTTHFRQLDVRIGKWFSIDPKANAKESPYASMGNNPIWYNDPLGDTIRTDGSKSAINDIKSMTGQYSSLVKIDENNIVTIDFESAKKDFYNKKGKLKEKKFEKFKKKALSNIGVSLINDMASDELNYFYSTSSVHKFEYRTEFETEWREFSYDVSHNHFKTVSDMSWFDNVSTTIRGDEAESAKRNKRAYKIYYRLADGYDGALFISTGIYYTNDPYDVDIPIRVSRASVVYHELQENYYRTHYKQPYKQAHNTTVGNENEFDFGNPNPGGFSKFTYIPEIPQLTFLQLTFPQ